MVCLGLKTGAAGLKAQTNPLSYGRTPRLILLSLFIFHWLTNKKANFEKGLGVELPCAKSVFEGQHNNNLVLHISEESTTLQFIICFMAC